MIFEGVSYNSEKDNFQFNFKNDTQQDIVFLKYNPKTIINKGSIAKTTAYYGYKINPSFKEEKIKQDFLQSLKNLSTNKISLQDYELLLTKAVVGLNRVVPINEFDIIIIPESSSPLVYDLALRVKNKAPNTVLAKDALVKNALDNIHIDYDKYLSTAKDEKDKEKRKKQLEVDFKRATESGTFKIKKVFTQRRGLFSNYLVVNSEAHRAIFNKIQGGKVLLIDDIITSGATIKEMLREIGSYAPEEIIIFSLIKN
jgi:hypothetical protein